MNIIENLSTSAEIFQAHCNPNLNFGKPVGIMPAYLTETSRFPVSK
jgi:hypothetical protein